MAPRLASNFDAFRVSASKKPFTPPSTDHTSQASTAVPSPTLQPAFSPDHETMNNKARSRNSNPAWGTDERPTADDIGAQDYNEGGVAEGGKGMTILTQVYALENMVKTELNGLKAQYLMLKDEVDSLKSGKVVNANSFGTKLPAPGTTNHPAADVNGTVAEPALSNSTAQLPDTEESKAKPSQVEGLPYYIQKLSSPALTSLDKNPLPVHSMQTFSFEFLRGHLGGHEWAPGFFADSEALPSLLGKARHLEVLTSKRSSKDGTNADQKSIKAKEKGAGTTYYIVDTQLQPFVPSSPGQHGALLAGFLHDFDDSGDRYKDVPIFVSLPSSDPQTSHSTPTESKQYIYVGSYTQSRWSDRLSAAEYHNHVPASLARFWATLLSNPDRPECLTEQLPSALGGPKPTYDGVLPPSIDKAGLWKRMVEDDIRDYLEDLKAWSEDADEALKNLTIKDALELFDSSDCDETPGIRFWWEYLECTGFERNFYYALASAAKANNGVWKQADAA